ncbi:hypothetical protein AB5J72_16600 [Streptomyces sp. CG1]|uniref:hypothetical protein n=1 Tax=Streptomyces sp. CG1 TaxID=1287523 RepID=UPI0034E2D608
MRRALPALLLTAVALLSGCGTGTSSDTSAGTPSDTPSGTSSTSGPRHSGRPPSADRRLAPAGVARDLAARYREAGGDRGVYAVTYMKSRDGAPVLTCGPARGPATAAASTASPRR